jgi:hypothetical protein
VLRVVNPDATPEEVAAIVAVVSALSGGEQRAPRRTPAWRSPSRRMTPVFPHGPGGWRASGLPR